jgi:hypothetical protein
MENLIVGSARWRSPYAGNKNILTKHKIKEIVNFIEDKGYKSIDTAPSYTDSDTIILHITKNLKISSKINAFSNQTEFIHQLQKIDTKKINTLYFHDQNLIENFDMKQINKFVQEILRRELTPRLSIYDIEILNKSKDYLNQEVLYQVPVNIFDLKFLKYLSKNKLYPKRVVFRSLFSTGLVFLSNERINPLKKRNF